MFQAIFFLFNVFSQTHIGLKHKQGIVIIGEKYR
jgi:hypothetical protein